MKQYKLLSRILLWGLAALMLLSAASCAVSPVSDTSETTTDPGQNDPTDETGLIYRVPDAIGKRMDLHREELSFLTEEQLRVFEEGAFFNSSTGILFQSNYFLSPEQAGGELSSTFNALTLTERPIFITSINYQSFLDELHRIYSDEVFDKILSFYADRYISIPLSEESNRLTLVSLSYDSLSDMDSVPEDPELAWFLYSENTDIEEIRFEKGEESTDTEIVIYASTCYRIEYGTPSSFRSIAEFRLSLTDRGWIMTKADNYFVSEKYNEYYPDVEIIFRIEKEPEDYIVPEVVSERAKVNREKIDFLTDEQIGIMEEAVYLRDTKNRWGSPNYLLSRTQDITKYASSSADLFVSNVTYQSFYEELTRIMTEELRDETLDTLLDTVGRYTLLHVTEDGLMAFDTLHSNRELVERNEVFYNTSRYSTLYQYTFELVSKTDDEILFNANTYYKYSSSDDYPCFKITETYRMVQLDRGWVMAEVGNYLSPKKFVSAYENYQFGVGRIGELYQFPEEIQQNINLHRKSLCFLTEDQITALEKAVWLYPGSSELSVLYNDPTYILRDDQKPDDSGAEDGSVVVTDIGYYSLYHELRYVFTESMSQSILQMLKSLNGSIAPSSEGYLTYVKNATGGKYAPDQKIDVTFEEAERTEDRIIILCHTVFRGENPETPSRVYDSEIHMVPTDQYGWVVSQIEDYRFPSSYVPKSEPKEPEYVGEKYLFPDTVYENIEAHKEGLSFLTDEQIEIFEKAVWSCPGVFEEEKGIWKANGKHIINKKQLHADIPDINPNVEADSYNVSEPYLITTGIDYESFVYEIQKIYTPDLAEKMLGMLSETKAQISCNKDGFLTYLEDYYDVRTESRKRKEKAIVEVSFEKSPESTENEIVIISHSTFFIGWPDNPKTPRRTFDGEYRMILTSRGWVMSQIDDYNWPKSYILPLYWDESYYKGENS